MSDDIPTNDPATGLPALPVGHFWRIARFNLRGSEYVLDVQLRRRRLIGSVVEANSLTAGSPKGIRNAAQYAYQQFVRAREAQATLSDATRHLGDYPPKRLEETP